MDKVSLADVAHALDAMIDLQMTAQARITAHLVAAAEAAGHEAARLIATLDDIAAKTVVDEFWISDEQGVVYVTNVRDARGALVPFRFDPDLAVQPQASAFHVLLSSSVDNDVVVTQAAQGREIDHRVYKYAGVSGVDRQRIVQVGNALAFEEQVRQRNAYASPVMTSVLAAFDLPELLRDTYTSEFDEIRPIFDEILGQQMIVQTTLVERFAAAAEEAGWSADGINGRLRRIVRSTSIGEIHIVGRAGGVLYTSSLEPLTDTLPGAGDLGPHGRRAASRGLSGCTACVRRCHVQICLGRRRRLVADRPARPARRRQLARISAVERHTVAAACRQQSALVLARSLSRLVNGGRFVCIGLASVIGIGVWSRGQVGMER